MGKRYGTIYKIENKVNGKVYIGQTVKQPKRRFQQHKSKLRRNVHDNDYLQAAWNKYGESSFEFIVLTNCDISALDSMEKELIEKYKRNSTSYNLEGGGNNQKEIHPTTKAKLSRIITNKHKNDIKYRKKYLRAKARKVICINTGEIFNSMADAAKQLGVSHSAIYMACIGKRDSVGGYSGKPMQIAYYEDGKEYKFKKLKRINSPKKVVCINTKEIFNSTREAATKYGCQQGHISECCNGKRKHAGRLEDGTYIKWCFLDDYDENEKHVFTKKHSVGGHRTSVRCITTGEVFDTMKQACERYGISRSTMWKMCTRKTNKGYELNNGMIVDFEYVQ